MDTNLPYMSWKWWTDTVRGNKALCTLRASATRCLCRESCSGVGEQHGCFLSSYSFPCKKIRSKQAIFFKCPFQTKTPTLSAQIAALCCIFDIC